MRSSAAAHLIPPSLPCPRDRIDEFLGEPAPEVIAALAAAPAPILVLGAGGKMGLHLSLAVQGAQRALGRKDRVIAVSRFTAAPARNEFERRGIATIACDLEKPGDLAGLPDGGTVFFLAGIKFGTARAPDLLRRLNVEMPARVAERYRAARIVAFSSGAVYPFMAPASGGAREDTPPAPVGAYAASCLARERAFAGAARRHGTPVMLIRLNYAVEFRYGVLVDIAQKVLRDEPVDVTMGQVNLIWQWDAVAHSIQALALAAAPAAPLNVAGPAVLSVRELAHRFGELFGRSPRIVGREADAALLSNASRSHGLFGRPRVSLDQMIAWVAAWLEGGGATWGKPTHFESRSGQY